MCNKEHFEELGDVKWFEDLKSAETMRVDGVLVKVDYSAESDTRITPNELSSYLDRGRAKEPNRKLVWLHLLVEGDDVAIHYGYEPEKFERIRRITGYLVGTLDRFNDAKRAEESERVKHLTSEKEIHVGKIYTIDLTALLLETLGSLDAVKNLEIEEAYIEFDQKLCVESAPYKKNGFEVDLYSDSTLVVCDGEHVKVEYVGKDRVVCRSDADTFNAVSFELTPEHAAKYLN